MKHIIKKIPGARSAWRLVTGKKDLALNSWKAVLEREADQWKSAREQSRSGRKVLVATSVGDHPPAVILEQTLAMALTLQGAEVHVLLCDGFLPACEVCHTMSFPDATELIENGPRRKCAGCYEPARASFNALGLQMHTYSGLVTMKEREEATRIAATIPAEEIAAFRLDGFAVGEHSLAGTLRFYARGTLEGEPHGEALLRRYLEAGILTARAMDRLFEEQKFECAVFHHGIYIPHGIVGEVARRRDVRVVNWNSAYRRQCFIFSHGDTYHHTLMEEPVSVWEDMTWSDETESEILDYLRSRWDGSRDWIKYHNNPNHDVSSIRQALGIRDGRPCIGLLTNVVWDAQLHYPANAFPNMLAWITDTISYFARRPDLQLIIRVHPAEISGSIPSRQPVVEEIAKAFPELPENVAVIGPGDNTSTYAAMLECNAVIIYGTKTGVELSSLGMPVIVAGEAWIRNKGVTLDATSPVEYFEILDSLPLPGRLDEAQTRRARKYAYHFFFRRMMPIECMEPTNITWPPYRLAMKSLDDLLPWKSPGLAAICQGILTGSPFIYTAEEAAVAP